MFSISQSVAARSPHANRKVQALSNPAIAYNDQTMVETHKNVVPTRSSRVSGTVGLLFAASFGLLGLCAVDGCTAPPATASAAELQDKAPEGASLRRVALVIGNGAYQNGIEVLANPSHDATAFAGVLRQHSFESL